MKLRLLILVLCLFYTLGTQASLPKVAVVTTGGTIAQKKDPNTGGLVPAISGSDLIDAVPGLSQLAEIHVVEVVNIDSSQMTPEIWARVSAALDKVLSQKDIVGAVVTHGTDTMALGAYFLDLTIRSDKPVVMTGAMNDADSLDPDGPSNLLNAVYQVLSPQAQNWGVTVTLNSYINNARAVRKTWTTNLQTFESGAQGYLGYIFDGEVTRLNDRLRRVRLGLPEDALSSLPKVPFISAYAGADGSLIRYVVDSGARGLVVEGVGAGNVNASVFEAIQYALQRDIPVVISSRVPRGAVRPVYADAGGGKTLEEAGCILAGDLMGEKARLLLILGVAQYGNDVERLRTLFNS
ncbi:MAG: asparaginase [Pseudomonadota bacterium]